MRLDLFQPSVQAIDIYRRRPDGRFGAPPTPGAGGRVPASHSRNKRACLLIIVMVFYLLRVAAARLIARHSRVCGGAAVRLGGAVLSGRGHPRLETERILPMIALVFFAPLIIIALIAAAQ